MQGKRNKLETHLPDGAYVEIHRKFDRLEKYFGAISAIKYH
jgi:hypothetical protein